MPSMLNATATKACSIAAVPPSRSTMSRVNAAVADLVADTVHDAADDQPVQAQPDGPQQQRAPLSRHARPNGPVSHGACRTRTGAICQQPRADVAAGQQPVGRARSAATVAIRCNSNTHHRSPANGRTCRDQPSGDTHDNGLEPVAEAASPTARRV